MRLAVIRGFREAAAGAMASAMADSGGEAHGSLVGRTGHRSLRDERIIAVWADLECG